MTAKKAVVGLVARRAQADMIVEALQRGGIAKGDISALFADNRGSGDYALESTTTTPEGAIVGGARTGRAFGGKVGLLSGIGALTIPGLGPFIAAGPLMAALREPAARAALGSVADALVGMGIPELAADDYEDKVAGGKILLAVHDNDHDQRTRAKQILEQGGAVEVSFASEQSAPAQRINGKPISLVK